MLLDVRMPELDGFAVCERLRALPGGAEVSIVFLTALRDDVETFDRALLVGANDFLTKPAQVTLEVTIDVPTLTAEQGLIRRVLENLAENAIRHAAQGSAVQLSTVLRAGEVEMRVTDRGATISSEMREKIFDRFVQLDSSSCVASRSGRGLGLTFCKLAIEAHGGHVWVEDATPGTAVCVRLSNDA